MISIKRTDSRDSDFIALVRLLDAFLAKTDGEENAFYAQFNKIDTLKYVVVVYEDQQAVGCGAFKPFNNTTVEIKRMYVLPGHRRKGIAAHILAELENWALDTGNQNCVLETGTRQPEAIALYKRAGYRQTENYGQYIGVENSVCFKKELGR